MNQPLSSASLDFGSGTIRERERLQRPLARSKQKELVRKRGRKAWLLECLSLANHRGNDDDSDVDRLGIG